MRKCEICHEEFKFLGKHIPKHNLSQKSYYDTYLKVDGEDVCLADGCSEITQFDSIWRGYLKTCSTQCSYLCVRQKQTITLRSTIDKESGLPMSTIIAKNRRASQLVKHREINPETGKTFLSEINRRIYESMSDESRARYHSNGGEARMRTLREEGRLLESI